MVLATPFFSIILINIMAFLKIEKFKGSKSLQSKIYIPFLKILKKAEKIKYYGKFTTLNNTIISNEL